MGKRYYCDFCDKTMVASPSVIRTHVKGIAHQKLVSDHYQKFKDPETILSEESKKPPCTKFARGECQFGGICRYSHYTAEQLQALHEYVLTKNAPKTMDLDPLMNLHGALRKQSHEIASIYEGSVILDKNGIIHCLPWSYNTKYDNEDVPPSLKRFEGDDFVDSFIANWG